MNRRAFVCGSVSVISASATAGCLSSFSKGTIGLHVLNWTTEEQVFDIRIANRSGKVRYDKKIPLPGGESARREDVLRGGQYTVTVSMQGGPTEEYDFEMGECADQEITVIYQGPTELDIHRKQC